MSENELIDYFNVLGFKDNPNDYNIVKKWNRKLYNQHKYDIFNWINKYIDEHITEFIQPQYDLVSAIVSASTFNYGDKINYNPTPIDNNEHIWYNTFNKWSWTKFENGVIKIDEQRSN